MNVSQFIDAMLDGTKQAYGIAIPTAACGIMTVLWCSPALPTS